MLVIFLFVVYFIQLVNLVSITLNLFFWRYYGVEGHGQQVYTGYFPFGKGVERRQHQLAMLSHTIMWVVCVLAFVHAVIRSDHRIRSHVFHPGYLSS